MARSQGLGGPTYAYLNFLYLADCSAVNHLDGTSELPSEFGALLAAGLKDHFVLLYGLHHAATLGDGE